MSSQFTKIEDCFSRINSKYVDYERFGVNVILTASAFYHQFAAHYLCIGSDFAPNQNHITLACILLATKCEDVAVTVDNIIHNYYNTEPLPQTNVTLNTPKRLAHLKLRTNVIYLERLLIIAINFNFDIDTPTSHFIKQLCFAKDTIPLNVRKEFSETCVKSFQLFYRDPRCIYVSPNDISAGCIGAVEKHMRAHTDTEFFNEGPFEKVIEDLQMFYRK